MLRLAADEDLNNHIVRGLLRRLPDLDLITVQQAGLTGSPDLVVLEWAAGEARVLLTQDLSSMVRHALDRVSAGKNMPGLVAVPRSLGIGAAIEDIRLLAEVGDAHEVDSLVVFLPL